MSGTFLVRVTDSHGHEIASAETPVRPSPPVESVEAMFPALRELRAYKVRITADEDGPGSAYGWDVDGHLVTLRGRDELAGEHAPTAPQER